MTSETYLDLTYDRKGQKRPSRPKLLKLTEVSMPHRNRKKTKLKVKERSQSNARERIYDDPAYTDDISHLALPLRRNSGPDKIEAGTFHKRKSNHKDNHYYTKRLEPPIYKRDGSSSSDNLPPDPGKNNRGQSLERANIIDRSPKKREKRDRSAKQRRNLSLDNTLSSSLRRSLEKSEQSLKTASIERTSKSKQKSSIQRQNASEGWNSCLAATSDSSKATENDETYSRRKDSKMQIGKRFLRGEIGIKSFNYYLIKEGLKSSKKFVEKQRNSLTRSDSKKLHTRSEENIYEEIFFVDKNSDDPEDHHSKYPDCELCMQECTKANCEYCFDDIRTRQQYFGSLGRNDRHPLITALGGLRAELHGGGSSMGAGGSNKFAHILEFQSYNPNNPGVYKIETTPVAFTSDYNPIHQFQPGGDKLKQITNYNHPQPPIPTSQIQLNQQHTNQIQMAAQQQQQQQQQRRTTRTVNQMIAPHLNTKSSSSSDSLHHKYARPDPTIGSLDLYEYQHPMLYGSTGGGIGNTNKNNISHNLPVTQYESPQIYKSDSKVSIISEYSVRSESSNRNFRCGEVSDSSLGDSMFSYSTQQRRYFGSSESCRFAFECRRCSLDGEKCSFSDTCRYECRNCDCSSSYFSSDFDDLNYNHRRRGDIIGGSQNSQRSYEYYNDSIDVKQNKYAQDFFKHVNDVKRSIYQAEIQGSNGIIDSYNSSIPPPKQIDTNKSINYDSQQQQPPRQFHRQQMPLTNNTNRSGDNGSPLKISSGHQPPKSYTTLPLMKDLNRDKKSSSITKRTSGTSQITDTSRKNLVNEKSNIVGGGGENISNYGTYSGGYGGGGNIPKIDKSIKYSDGKIYAKPIGILDKQEKQRDLTSDRNTVHSRKRETGAIPKLSSSTSSSCSPHQSISSSHQKNLNQEQNTIKQNIVVQQNQSKSPNTSPTKPTRKRQPNNNPDINQISLMTTSTSQSTNTSTYIIANTSVPVPNNSTDDTKKIINSTTKEPTKKDDDDNNNKRTTTDKISSIQNYQQQQEKSSENHRKDISLRKYYQGDNDKMNLGHKDSIIIQKKQRRNEKINSKNEASLSASQPELCSSSVVVKVMTGDVDHIKGKKKLKSIKNTSSSSKSTISHRGYSQEYLTIDDDDDDEVFYDARNDESRKRDSKRKRSLGVPISSSSSTLLTSSNKNINNSTTAVSTTNSSAVKQSNDKKNNDKIITNKKCEYQKNNLKDDRTPLKDKQKKSLTTMSLYSQTTTTTTITSSSSFTSIATPTTAPSSAVESSKTSILSTNTKNNNNNNKNCDNLIPQDDNLQPQALKMKSTILMPPTTLKYENENSLNENEKLSSTKQNKKDYLQQNKALRNSQLLATSTKAQINVAQQHVATNSNDLSMKFKQIPHDLNVSNKGEIINNCESFSVNTKSNESGEHDHKQFSSESKANNIDIDKIDDDFVNDNNNSKISQNEGEFIKQEKKTGLLNDTEILATTTIIATTVCTTTVTATTTVSFTDITNTTTTTTTTLSSAVAAVIDTTSITNCADDEFSRITNAANVAGAILNRDQTEQQQQSIIKDQITKYQDTNNKNIDITSDAATSTDESYLTRTSEDRRDSNDLSSTADKIDISDLPLPALPPKRGRNRSKILASVHQQQQQTHIDSHHKNDYSDPRLQYAARRRESLETSTRNFNEKLEARKMHYHSMGHMGHHNLSAGTAAQSTSNSKPTYLFGENQYHHQQQHSNYLTKQQQQQNNHVQAPATTAKLNNDEIYLNKSGWVQVNSKRINDENFSGNHNRKSNHSIRTENQNGFIGGGGGNNLKNSIRVIQIGNTGDDVGGVGGVRDKQQQPVYAVPRITNSKIEELISRNEARRNMLTVNHRQYMKPGYKIIDPQIASLLNERPGFLPVKTFMDLESPPPITPILSPPPAFQDTKAKYRNLDAINSSNVRIQINPNCNGQQQRHDPKTNKGMVFSRSFEYDRKPTDHYAETFSKSFDCNLSDKPSSVIPSVVPQKRDRSPNFGNLTGCSPNYLTKKETTRSRESSPKYQTQGGYLNTTNSIIGGPIKEVPVYCNPRKLDKSKTTTSNSFDRNGRSRRAQFTRVTSTPNPPPPPVSRFRSFDTNINQRLNSCDSGARSDLSNDEIDDDDEHSSEFLSASYQSQSSFKQNKQRSLTPERYDSQGSQNSLRKQRSLTPESRSLTPEDRRKKGSQVSLSSRQNSRNNTLERKQKFDDKSLSASRSSSSSSYSGREHLDIAPSHRRATTRNPKTPEEHRIRRSRSLQLSEKSPNRTLGHKNGGQQISSSMNKQQSVRQLQQHQIRNTNFPPTIRPNQIITSDPLNTIIINNRNIRSNNDIDKSRSFDFDYSPYNNQKTNNVPIGGGGSGGVNRLDFDKSRSFDEDYREQSNKLRKYLTDNTQMGISQSNSILKSSGSSNNNSTTGLTPSIQTTAPRTSATGLERNAGSGSGGSSSGSGQRQTSPQNYGTRLCDHEMTYDMLRRTLDRSPIMDFSRDYDIPQSMKNRETINAGGNSELNFTSDRIYDHNLLKQQLLINNKQHLLNQSPSDSSYSLDRLNSSSRDSITPDSSEMKSIRDALNIAISDDRLRSEYALYRQQRSLIDRNNGSGSNASSCNQTGSTQAASVSRGSCTNTSKSNDYWPNCRGGVNKSKNIKSKQLKHQQHQLLNCRCNNCTGNTNCIETNNLTHNNTKLFILSDDNNYDDDDIDDYDSLYENVREINKIKNIIKCGNNNNNNNNRNNKNSVKKIIGVEQKSQISCKNCNNLTNYHRNSNSNRELKVNSGSGGGELKRVGSDGYYKKNENILKKKSSISLKQLNLHEHENRIVTKPPIYVHSTAPATINTLKLPVTPPAATTTIIFLSEREMPITRESTKNNLSPTTIMSSGHNHHQNCDDDVGSVSEDEGNFCSLDNAMISRQNTGYSPTMGSDYRSVRPTKIRLKIGTSNNYYYRIYKKQQSLSLPNLYIQTEFPSANLMDNESDKCDLFSSSLINQIRSVSSPSLTDNPLDINIKNKNNINNDDDNNQSTENYNNSPFTTTVSVNNQQNYPSVLQKFKRTFSQFSGVGGNNNSNNNGGINSNNNNNNNNTNNNKNIQQITNTSINLINNDIDSSGKYRFGPLIWRSSKERRKTKYNRRDKCNSGDSGIQIELENEETFMQDGQDESIESTITSTTTVQGNNSSSNSNTVNNTGLPIIVRGIRRTNSAKLTNSMKINFSGLTTAKAKALKKLDNSNEINFNNKLKPKRSLSQPTGLDRMARNDLDDSDTDSVSSHPDLHEAHRSIYAEILFPFTPAGPQELPLERGGLVEILRKDIGPWWYGKIKHDAVIEKILEPQQGWFPKDFVRIIPPPYFDHHNHNHQDQVINDIINDCHHHNQQTDIINNHQSDKIENITNSILLISNNLEENSDMTTTTIKNLSDLTKTINNKSTSQNNNKNINSYNNITNNSNNCSSLPVAIATTAANQLKLVLHTNQNLRNSVIKELLETEINYVKLLSTLCLGYLREMRKRIDIFPTESLNLIFSNIENVWQFQQIFLNTLRKGIETGHIGQAFLDHQSGFLVYSNYCNSYPRALMELESYSSNKDAKIILENIRVAENLSNLPLSAHLLAPIQRICRYPLHLAELVKHSPSTSSLVGLNENNSSNNSGNLSNFGDTKESLEIALNAMKKVTETVNEGKRHSEHLTRFQASFDNFQGPPIAFHSTRFFMQTDATRVSPNLWNNTYTLFLFDRQLIYCKKDILKRNHFIYKGRIFLDNCRILNLPDGKMFGVTLKNALRIYCESLNKWFDFCFRSASRKLRFLSTLAVERQFCGTNLFVSELVGNNDDDGDNLSDREYHSDYDTPLQTQQNSENNLNNLNWKTNLYDCDKIPIDCNGINSSTKLQKYCDTLPKKSKKQNNRNGRSNNGNSSSGDNNYDNYNNTSSLGRRKLGSWFRKAKSTNSTPTQSPTHNPNMIVFSSDSSSQSSPALDGGGTYKSTVVVQQGTTTTK